MFDKTSGLVYSERIIKERAQDPPDMLRRAIRTEPGLGLEPYVTGLNSDRFAWLTVLHIRDARYISTDLMKLAELRNLVCLHVDASSVAEHCITDRIIRGWSHEAETRNAFPKLRMMILRNQPEFTASAFRYLDALPALTAFCLARTTRKEKRLMGGYGWRRKTSDFHAHVKRLQETNDHKSTNERQVDWQELVDSYVLGDRKTLVADDKDHTPILAIELSSQANIASSQPSTLGSPDNILWFEKITVRKPEPQPSESLSRPGSQVGKTVGTGEPDQGHEAGGKRRKLRAGKQASFAGLF
ncbi:hypothetical protein MBLNU459_g6743t1 [Dothideomycetes sp. NU459]